MNEFAFRVVTIIDPEWMAEWSMCVHVHWIPIKAVRLKMERMKATLENDQLVSQAGYG